MDCPKMNVNRLIIFSMVPTLFFICTTAQTQRPIVLDPNYNHDKWQTLPKDHQFKFAAFTTSFDGADDNNGDGDSDAWGIPEWVAFEIKGNVSDHPLANRPRKWITDPTLQDAGLAPNDATYAVPGTTKLKEVKTDYRFVRGHMCPKDTAERISADAAYNTHTVLNAVPQLQWQNNGVWKTIEQKSIEWADKYDQIWVVCGPIFFKQEPAMWLGQDGEKKAAIPDALFKIIIREDGNSLKTLAFLIPNIVPKTEKDPISFLTSIKKIETHTKLTFLNTLSSSKQRQIKSKTADNIDW